MAPQTDPVTTRGRNTRMRRFVRPDGPKRVEVEARFENFIGGLVPPCKASTIPT